MATQKAGTILINLRNKKIALVYRRDKLGYEFPKGHLEEGETLEECAIRETEEETERKSHIIENLGIVNYTTERGEEVELHLYLAIVDGKSHEVIEEHLKEKLYWFSVDEVEAKLKYDDTKRFWKKTKKKILDLINRN